MLPPAILFGVADLLIIGVPMGTLTIALVMLGTRMYLGLGVAAATGLFGWQQWLIRNRERDACLAAFRHNNWVGLTLWIGIALALAVS